MVHDASSVGRSALRLDGLTSSCGDAILSIIVNCEL
jgi:hypothetical protein